MSTQSLVSGFAERCKSHNSCHRSRVRYYYCLITDNITMLVVSENTQPVLLCLFSFFLPLACLFVSLFARFPPCFCALIFVSSPEGGDDANSICLVPSEGRRVPADSSIDFRNSNQPSNLLMPHWPQSPASVPFKKIL